jgi:hypothetical protein
MAASKGNKNAIGNNGGRPALFTSPETLQEKINEYFESGVKEKNIVVGKGTKAQEIKVKIPTITGLCYFLGFESRQSFYAYEDKIEFCYIIKRARLNIEQEYEEQLSIGNTIGSIFALKNMGWSDKQEIEHSGNISSLPEITIKTNNA